MTYACVWSGFLKLSSLVGFQLAALFGSPKVRIAILIIYWILGFIVTHIPMRGSGEVLIPNLDKLAHFVLYGGLGFLMAIWLGSGRETRIAVRLTVVVCILYAFMDEGLQYFVPTRNASFYDWVADVIGATVGVTVYALLRSTFGSKTSTED